jgi:hypothetical protein
MLVPLRHSICEQTSPELQLPRFWINYKCGVLLLDPYAFSPPSPLTLLTSVFLMD